MAIDPRTDRARRDEGDVRPLIAPPRSGVPAWVFAIALALFAVLLFALLDARRRAITVPAVKPAAADLPAGAGRIAPLYVPPVIAPAPPPEPIEMFAPPPRIFYPPPPRGPQIIYQSPPGPPMHAAPPPATAAAGADAPALIVDTTSGDAAALPPPGDAGGNPANGGTAGNESGSGLAANTAPARATMLRRRATTVVQGTMIPAVLETALDSTRPGYARAVVSRDVRSYDGSRVLIARGSRLIGEYRSDLAPGQNRAFVTWTRLIRPDGVTIAIGSPAADALGRAGIKGKVNSHFLARFGAAILQSTLDVGVNLASRIGNGGSSTIVALPGIASPAMNEGNQVRSTLTVKQGSEVTVFVARDLDFTSVEPSP